MAAPHDIVLDVATLADATLLSNLLELYAHDLSAAFPSVELGPDGRYGYRDLALYWSEPERRFPFLIRCDSRVAGFALAQRGSPATDDPDVFDVAEFFVLRRYRHSGVGRRAAILLWNRRARSTEVGLDRYHGSRSRTRRQQSERRLRREKLAQAMTEKIKPTSPDTP
jgi:predicted acetyltransferase